MGGDVYGGLKPISGAKSSAGVQLPMYLRIREQGSFMTNPAGRGYEVVLDVWGRCFRLRYLASPQTIFSRGEQRPVVVCQHGLEGRPQDTADPRIESVYLLTLRV